MPTGKDKHSYEAALDLISAASRDMKAPLHLIKGLNDLMASGEITKEQHALYVRRIASSVTQMERILETIESLDRLVAEANQVALEPIGISEVLETISNQLQAKADDYGQKLVIKNGNKSALVLSNRRILENAVYGLVDSAIVYSEPNSEILVRPSRTMRTGFTRLSVRDKSTGVTRKDWNRVMSKLGKVDAPNQAFAGDSGLGLFATVRLVESLDGFVGMKTFRSGSSFFIELPIAKQLELGFER